MCGPALVVPYVPQFQIVIRNATSVAFFSSLFSIPPKTFPASLFVVTLFVRLQILTQLFAMFH